MLIRPGPWRASVLGFHLGCRRLGDLTHFGAPAQGVGILIGGALIPILARGFIFPGFPRAIFLLAPGADGAASRPFLGRFFCRPVRRDIQLPARLAIASSS